MFKQNLYIFILVNDYVSVILNHPCSCDKHPGNANGICGAAYIYFGHEGWGEPYGRGHHCHACDSCYPSGFGLAALSKEKQNIQTWLQSDGPDTLSGQTSFIIGKTSWAISKRLAPTFISSIMKKNIGITELPTCGAMFLFETEVAGYWERSNKGTWELNIQSHYDVFQSRWALDPKQLEADIRRQKPSCPICSDPLRLMMHEGWVKAPAIGYGEKPRPIRVYYLSCNHDWTSYRPNNPIKSNEGAPPFNQHPTNSNNQCSFWHSQQRYKTI